MIVKNISKLQIFFFSFLALPLSFVGIPIYLNVSDFYARKFEINLATIGILLIFIRIIDVVQDPLIGYLSDLLSQKKIGRKKIICTSSTLLCFAFYLVFNPPESLGKNLSILWFCGSLIATYTCFNFTIINFESLAAIFAKNDQERIALNSSKEMFGVIGMIFAFLLPTILVSFFLLDAAYVYPVFSFAFAALMLLASFGFFRKIKIEKEFLEINPTAKIKFLEILRDKKFLVFLAIFFLNAVAVSLPAANLNFYINDILHRPENLGWFLSIYFISACVFIPFWKYCATKFGMIRSWIFSISGSVLTFSFAYFLTSENADYFYLVCFFSGAFLGADLIMPPAILAKITSAKKEMISSYFSWWNLTAKMSLMIAASSSLIVLGLSGYKPGLSAPEGVISISFFYALLPCVLKIFTIINLVYVIKKFPFYET